MLGSIASQTGSLCGSIRAEANLVGHISITIGHEYYTGNYNVTPKIEQQVLETRDKLMSDDVTVKGIPFYEVSNPQGGTTFIIGGD